MILLNHRLIIGPGPENNMHDTRGWRPNFVPDIFHWNDLAVGKQVNGEGKMPHAESKTLLERHDGAIRWQRADC